MTSTTADGPQAAVGRTVRWMMALLLFIAVVLAVQTITYDGLIFRLAEWQFSFFDRYFPPLTIALLVGIAAIIWLVLRRTRAKAEARRRSAANSDVIAAEAAQPAIELAKITRAHRVVGVITLVLAAATVGTGIHYLQLPGPTRQVTTIDLTGRTPTLLREGSVRVTGIRPLGPVARFSNDILLSRQNIFLLPVGRTRLEDGSEAANLFVQVNGSDRARLPGTMSGLLRTSALPHEVAVMYRNADFPVAANSAVVFASENIANHGTLMTLLQLAVLTLIGGVFTLFTRRRQQRIAASIGGADTAQISA